MKYHPISEKHYPAESSDVYYNRRKDELNQTVIEFLEEAYNKIMSDAAPNGYENIIRKILHLPVERTLSDKLYEAYRKQNIDMDFEERWNELSKIAKEHFIGVLPNGSWNKDIQQGIKMCVEAIEKDGER
jgi:uncharacterized HAD superfamily protein